MADRKVINTPANTYSKADQRLILNAQISERALIVYILKSDMEDNKGVYSKDYAQALKDEIKNHNAAIADYKKALKRL
jgi:hypothetical protein